MLQKKLLIMVIGDGGVGKSAFSWQWCKNEYMDIMDPTIEDIHKKVVNVDGIDYEVELFDSINDERDFSAFRDHAYQKADAFILMYDLTYCRSFDHIGDYIMKIQKIRDLYDMMMECPPIVVVGNKSDRENDIKVSSDSSDSEVKYFVPVRLDYMTCSARYRINIDEVIHKVISRVIEEGIRNPVLRKDKKDKCGLQ